MVKIKSISFILAVLIMSFLIGYFVFAWQEPQPIGVIPPGGNVPAPINVGSDLQEKTGTLLVYGFQTRSHTYLATDVGINVGIGTTSPLQKLHSTGYIRADSGYCIGTSCITSWPSGAALPTGSSGQTLRHTGTAWVANSIIFNNGTNVGIGVISPSYPLHVSGSVGASAFYYTSDERLKENIKPLEESLSKILKLNGISYQLKATSEEKIGLSAQQVQKLFPEAVNEDDNGILSIDSAALIAPLIEAIKEQQQEIEQLKIIIENK